MAISRFITAAVLAAILNSPANADSLSSSDLLEYCISGTLEHNYYCEGYIAGVIGATFTAANLEDDQVIMRRICFPEVGLPSEQVKAIVIKYLDEQPEKWHYTPSSNVMVALMKAFPCEGSEYLPLLRK